MTPELPSPLKDEDVTGTSTKHAQQTQRLDRAPGRAFVHEFEIPGGQR